jgi:hypothetical protein
MQKRMEPIVVRTTEQGKILLVQEYGGGGTQQITLDPAQIGTVIHWMQEALQEIETASAR